MPEPSDLKAHLGYWMRFVSNHVSHAFARKVEAHGVTVAEWAVLRELYDAGAIPPSQLAERMGMTRGAITKLADRLIAKELIARTLGTGDRRFQTLAITGTGRALVPELAGLADVNDAHFFGHMSARDRDELRRLLTELVRHHDLKTIPTE